MAAGWKDALMADTGAPWNIPYVEPADLVRDYPAADEAQALAIAAGLDVGLGTNVVQTVKADTFTTTSETYVVPTGLAASITPTSATSKVLVIATLVYSFLDSSTERAAFASLFRAGTNLASPSSPGDRTAGFHTLNLHPNIRVSNAVTAVFLDAPNTEASVEYDVRVARLGSTGTVFVNRSSQDSDISAQLRAVSTLTLIEVAA
jgi:hypothetical protein